MIMNIRWKKLFFTTFVWLSLEVILTVLGLDDLADCGEYVLNKYGFALLDYTQPCLILFSFN